VAKATTKRDLKLQRAYAPRPARPAPLSERAIATLLGRTVETARGPYTVLRVEPATGTLHLAPVGRRYGAEEVLKAHHRSLRPFRGGGLWLPASP